MKNRKVKNYKYENQNEKKKNMIKREKGKN
jgi:hypothetical protein